MQREAGSDGSDECVCVCGGKWGLKFVFRLVSSRFISIVVIIFTAAKPKTKAEVCAECVHPLDGLCAFNISRVFH